MTVFEFLYCSCIHESAMATYSIHKTREGAIKAKRIHKAKLKRKYEKMYPNKKDRLLIPFGLHTHWDVIETKIFE